MDGKRFEEKYLRKGFVEKVRFSVYKMESVFTVTFSDNGIEFDPVRAPFVEKTFEELDKGGMGIKLARAVSDEMTYNRVRGRNVLTLLFRDQD